MSKELVISANRHETRVALLEDDQLVEVYFQRANEYSLAGSIHKGRVTRVLPGMQSAFVDLGLERDTFLYVSDFLEEHEDIDRVTGDERHPREPREREPRDREPREQNRERRQAMRPPQEALAPAAASESGEAPAAVEGASPLAGEVPASGAVSRGEHTEERPAASGDRPDDRDRRGRRSRRRRQRGRGFPDSKYAEVSPAGAAPAVAPAAYPAPHAVSEALIPEVEVAEEPLPEKAEVRIVLPGESLAKYRGAPRPSALIEPERRREAVPPPLPTPEELEEQDIRAEQGVLEEPTHYPPENALPDAPVHAGSSAAAEEPLSHEAAYAEDAAQSGPVTAPLLDEDEDLDIQAMILGEAMGEAMGESGEALAEEETGASEEEALDGEEIPLAEGAEPANGSDPNAAEQSSGTAEVRERSGRFPHRVSRRGRRRPRGEGRGDGRGPDRGPENRPPEARGPETREPREQREGRGPRPEGERSQGRAVTAQAQGTPSISDLVKEGQEIIVQIAKEPLGQKGARITSHIALPGRFVVYMPTLEHMGVSRKIASDEERLRLKRVLQGRRPGPVGGFITRTAAEGRTEEEIAADMLFLYNLWQDIRAKADKKPAPALLHHDLDIVQRILRDQLGDSFKAIWIDNEEAYESVLRFVERFQPALVGKVKMYTREAPIFDAFGVTNELEKALRPKVWLKSGGYIVINQTEALVAIDVNTGKFVGKSNRLEDTIVKTNTEAIKEIVRQVRLRDLGGIIVIDFIDMDERKNRQKVMQVLEETMRADRAPYKILQFNDFGLVAIDVNTGKFVGKSNRLEDTIVKTNTEAIKEIVRQVRLRDLGGIIVID
ncbi:MAG TPA: Rne/Rng family ribonuclease, partial [Bryobacteraceae bacterium]